MSQRRRGGGRRRGIVLGLGLLVVVVGAVGLLAGRRLAGAARDLRAASDLVDDAGDAIEGGHLADARANLGAARVHLRSATSALHGAVELDLLAKLPFLSDDVAQVRDSVALATTLVTGGERILTAAAPLEGPDGRLEVPLAEGAIPLEAVAEAGREATLLAASLPGADEARARDGLLGPVAELRDRVADAAVHRKGQLEVLARGLALLTDMAGGHGDRRYLIAVANTAEMRGSGGMVLSYGALVGRNGDFELEDVERIDGLYLTGAVPPVLGGAPDDYLTRWDGFEPLRLWRNANLAGDFTIVAPVMEVMYGAATGHEVSGVIQIDAHGLASILEGVGPVEVPGIGTVTADDVVELVLSEAYRRYPATDDRADVLGDVAEAVFRELVEGRYDSLRPLADALLGAIDGRHLMVHSVAARAQDQLRYFGADGALPPADTTDSVHLTVQNVSANKLDYYLDTALELTGERPAGELGDLRATVTIANTAPPGVGSPEVVFGPFDASQQAGLYRGVVSLYLPLGTSLVGVAGDALPDPPVAQIEGGRPVIGFRVDVPAGATRTVVLDLTLAPRPSGPDELVVVPQPRVRPTRLAVSIGAGSDPPLAGAVVLDRTWRFATGAEPIGVAPRSGRVPVGRDAPPTTDPDEP